MRARRALGAALVASLVVGGGVGTRTVIVDADARREAALAEQAATEAHRDDLRAALDGVRSDIARARRGRYATTAAARDVMAETAEHRSATEVASISLYDRGVQLAGTEERLAEVRRRLEEATTAAGALRACVDGVAAAVRATHAEDQRGAVRSLEAVSDACRAAQAARGPVGPTARFPFDFPDPYIVAAGGKHFAYATNSAGGAVQMLRSEDLQRWVLAGTALSSVPGWARPGATWAPSVLQRPSGWVMYYSVAHAASGRHCISVATAGGPAGPFVDTSTGPLVCNLAQGGSIDPSPFVAPDGAAYLLWKDEGETIGGTASLRAQRLAPDGLALEGTPATLLRADQAWEGRTVEGPSLILTPAGLMLLYSANSWDTSAYAVGAARCDSPMGPCHKLGRVLSTDGAMVGPGGAEAFVDVHGILRAAFHSWRGDAIGYPDSRYLHIATLSTSGGGVHLALG